MVTYNLTDIDAQNETTGMVREINEAFSGFPWLVVMTILWLAAYAYAINRNSTPKEAFLVSSFFMSVIGGLSYLAQFISVEIAIIPIITLIGSYIFIRMG